MAAPLSGHGLSKQMTFRLIVASILSSVVIGALVYIPANSKRTIDVIHNPLPVILLYSVVVTFCEILSWISTNQNWSRFKVSAAIKGILILSAGCILFHIIAVLYGAPFFEATAETFHFSLLLTVSSVFPACLILGPNPNGWVRVFAQNRPDLGHETRIYITSIASIVGAWLGAFPIPLDWDRPWQVWPISCVLGTLAGYCVGHFVAAIHLYYKYTILKTIKLT